jgi:peptidoglycan/LPS O-acetylase OafA/YrhL
MVTTAVINKKGQTDVPKIASHPLRTDIQALRALAVLSVVLFHLWPQLLPGGFVGVDVFFVISGYLITAHLYREVKRTGRLRLAKFWAARARRLLPASLLTLLVTALAVLLLVPQSRWDQFLSEIMASAGYVQNWLLASNSVDYLAADNVPSATQHFWSLSVEEQFYVTLPLLMLAGVVAATFSRLRRTRLIPIVLVVVTIGSFGYSLYLTSVNPGVAYFSTFTRMWELSLGGLASFAAPAVLNASRRTAAAHTALTLIGGVAIVVSFFVIDSHTPFPGYAAALPVLGAAAVVRWGGSTFATTIGALQPAAVLGRISYALYLWHWPLIILLPFITFRPLNLADKLMIFALAVSISWVSTRIIEEPLRFSFAQRVRPATILIVAALAMVPVMLVPAVGKVAVDQHRARHVSETERILREMPACLGAASMDPANPNCVNTALDDVVVPDPVEAINDRTSHRGCSAGVDDVEFVTCTIGPKSGYDLRLAAVGDSHNRTLMPAYVWMAKTYNWRIDVSGRSGCYWTTAHLERDNSPRSQRERCDAWRDDLAAHLDRSGFDAVLTTHASAVSIEPRRGKTYEQTTVHGMVKAWTSQTPPDVPVIAILDNPQAQETNAPCVEHFGATDPARCAAPRDWALRRFDGSAQAVKKVDKASLVDMTSFYCGPATCPSVIGGVMVYRDNTHLTATYVATLAPYLGGKVRAALREQGVS